jgi:ferritin
MNVHVFLLVTFAHTATAFSEYLSQLSTPSSINGMDQVNGSVNGYANGGASIAPQAVQRQGGPSQHLLDLISKQVSVELMASQAYMSASIWFRSRDLDGMAAWMLDESDEERGHGKEILEFAMKSHFPVTLDPLAAPRSDWETPDQVWTDILALEQNNTRNLLAIAAAASECHQYGVMAFLDPFHVEQIEAEDKVGGIVAKVRGASGNEGFLRELDHLLGLEAEEEHH